jgi:hypothetical protein
VIDHIEQIFSPGGEPGRVHGEGSSEPPGASTLKERKVGGEHCGQDDPGCGVYHLVLRAVVDQLAAIVKNRLKSIQYRPDLINGFLAQTGLTLEPEPP